MDNYYYYKHDDDDENMTSENENKEFAEGPSPENKEHEPKKKKKSGLSFGQKIGVTLAGCAAAGLVVGGAVGAYNVVNNLSATSREAAAQTQTTNQGGVTFNNNETDQPASDTTEPASSGSSTTLTQHSDDDESNDMTVEELAAASLPGMVAITNVSVQEVQNYYGGYGDIFNQFFGNGSGSYGYGSYGSGSGSGSYGSGSNSGNTTTETSAGSGVIIANDGSYIYMVTNQHVVADETELSVAFCDESVAAAEVVGEDETNDIALIKVAVSDVSEDTLNQIAYIPIGDSSELKIGQSVVAIGNALGYGQSVSSGIVSALNRSMDGGTGIYATGLIQTDAAINPGNSGGALLDMDGNLVGINSAKYASTNVEGMGYAIPIDSVYDIVTSMMNGTYSADTDNGNEGTEASGSSVEATSDAYLGISCASITEQYAQYYSVPQGVYVDSTTEGGAAANAGIESGDIITGADGQTVTCVDDLTTVLNNHEPGDQIQITIYRNGQTGTANVTLGSRSENNNVKTSY